MSSFNRWAVAGVVIVAIIVFLFFWSRGDDKPAPAKTAVITQAEAPKKAEPAPVTAAPMAATVLFEFDRAVLRPEEARKLDELVGKIKGRASDRLDAVGHADRIGSNEYNLQLSKGRADAVRAYLSGKGIDAARIRTEAKGESEPVTGDACKGPDNRKNPKLIDCLQRDRRVEVKVAAAR